MSGEKSVVAGSTLHRSVPDLPRGRVAIPTLEGTAAGPPIWLTDQALGQHVLVVGGIGQGKTNTIYHILDGIRSAMGPEDIAIVFDTKGDYLDRFHQSALDVVLNDPRAARDADPWNLFEELRASEEDPEETLGEIGYTLFDEAIEGGREPFWPLAAKDVFCGVLRRLARDRAATNRTLRDFWRRARRPDIVRLLRDDSATAGLVDYIGLNGPQALGVLAHIRQVADRKSVV